jgi:hypothetical protein
LPEPYPVFHVTAITHRKDAVYPATIVGIPPMEDFYIGGASVKLFLPIFKMNFPEIVDIALPAEGVFHNLVIISSTITSANVAGEFAQFVSVWGGGRDGIVEMLKVDLSPTELWTYTTNPDERNARARVARLKPEWPMVLVVAYLAQQHPRGLTAESLTEIDESLLTDLSAATAA